MVEGALLAAVGEYAAEVAGCPADRIAGVARFRAGNRHAVFKVTHRTPSGVERSVVVRVSSGAGEEERAQAQREATVLQLVGGVAAPELYDFQPASRWLDAPAMCIQFIPGRPRDLRSATAADIERLGTALCRVHQRGTGGLDESFTSFATAAAYAEARLRSILGGVSWVRDPLPAGLQGRLRAAVEVLERSYDAIGQTASFTTHARLALLHGDPAADNVLWSPDPVLIDWEYARLGDPADEVAYLFDQNGLSPAQRRAFWRGYHDGTAGHDERTEVAERVTWWEPVTLLGSTLWWVERWVRRSTADAAGRADAGTPREPGYYLDRIIQRIDRLEGLLARHG